MSWERHRKRAITPFEGARQSSGCAYFLLAAVATVIVGNVIIAAVTIGTVTIGAVTIGTVTVGTVTNGTATAAASGIMDACGDTAAVSGRQAAAVTVRKKRCCP